MSLGPWILPLLRLAAWAYGIQPVAVQRFWGRALGVLLRALKLRAKVVRQNLEIAFPSDPAARERLYREAYEHLGALVLDILMLFGPMRRYVERQGDLLGVEHYDQAIWKGKGVIFLASHVGNWEIMAATGALKHGIEIMLVTKHLKPEWLHRAIEKGRLACGVRATYEPRTLKDVLSWLKKGKTVGFVLDQYAGPPVGVRVPVFGVPVGTTTAVAMLAKRTGAVVLPVGNHRGPDGRWRVEIRAPVEWEGTDDPERATFELAHNTARYAREIEGDILAHPGQWLWIHRRFKGDLSPLRPAEWGEGRARS